MQSAIQPGALSKKSLWAGRIMSGLVAAFMIFDAVIHLMKPAPVVEAFAKLGFPLRLAVPLGIIELVCISLYVVPRTSILGAILLTGYLGGAIAIQLPTGNSLFGEVLFPVYIGVILWGGIYLRDERLRTMIPLRSYPGPQ
jgi:DoxX-like protein